MTRPRQIDFGFNVARLARRLRQAVDAELHKFGLIAGFLSGHSFEILCPILG